MRTTDYSVYNSLMDVEDANRIFKGERTYEAALDKLGKAILRHGHENVIGARLLHRHNDLRPGDVMVEFYEELEGDGPALTTQRFEERVVGAKVPAVWACLSDGDITPLEYCDASLSPVPATFFDEARPLFAEAAAIVQEFDLDNLIGLSLLNKDALKYDNETHAALEITDEERVANVVTVKSREDVDLSKHIETTWTFDSNVVMSCIRNCYSYCVIYSPGHAIKHHNWHSFDD